MAVQFSAMLENLQGLLSLLRLIVLYPVLWNKNRIKKTKHFMSQTEIESKADPSAALLLSPCFIIAVLTFVCASNI